MNVQWQPSLYTAADVNELVALCQHQPGKAAAVSAAYIRWQREANPAGIAQLGVAKETPSGKIIGLIWLLPLRMQVGDRVYLGSQSLYALVHPDHRGRGIFSRLVQFCDRCGEGQGYRFAYGFPNPASHPLFVHRLNWTHLGEARLYIRPLNPARLLARRLGFKELSWLPAGTGPFYRPRPLPARAAQLAVAEVETQDHALDDFWERVRCKYPLMVVRDRTFLHWRYTQIPDRSYRLIAARQEGRIQAIIILRKVEIQGIPCGMIVDFLAAPGDWGSLAGELLLAHAAAHFQQQNVDLLGCLMLPHVEEVAILRRQGYRICPRRLQPQPFSVILQMNESTPARAIVSNLRSWFLTMGDFDAV